MNYFKNNLMYIIFGPSYLCFLNLNSAFISRKDLINDKHGKNIYMKNLRGIEIPYTNPFLFFPLNINKSYKTQSPPPFLPHHHHHLLEFCGGVKGVREKIFINITR